ncbi:MAG: UDP-N-acetylmuramoyl-L-alanyl-D-glutamate--2,6-diaminopimelate ligase [Betaproteobacteria bacterium]|nr:UDP-N-acetylmuramoyl-L-alanyl-D-glutamate--2,6-diaminopimelate ligase [Betaproteobacteria bacterium]
MLSAQGVEVRALTADSRSVGAGDVFLAYPGHNAKSDGRHFIRDAVGRGAGAVLWERTGYTFPHDLRVPQLPVDGLKVLAGPLASMLYGAPSEQLTMVGITGTNGKTSVSQWTAQAMNLCGRGCGAIGTLGAQYGAWSEAVPNTTPDAIVLQRMLKRMVDSGAAACAMEVSSIGLEQARVDGVAFDIAVFTNFTRDHLDYHGDMRAYEEAKTRLFTWPGLSHVVINIDDPMGVRLMARLADRIDRIAYCIEGKSAVVEHVEDEGRLTASDLRYDDAGVRFTVTCDWNGAQTRAEVSAPVWGEFNVSNLLAVLGALLAAGVDLQQAVAALGQLTPPAGRMNAIVRPNAPLLVIDYAHTPDALDKALTALKPIAHARGGKLAVVFGCGGDRDTGKRPQMGEVASRLADRVIITSDNPRSENPLTIIAQILPGAPGAIVEQDRARAILQSVREAAPADVVLIAGKGHEDYQEIAGQKLPFSDHKIATIALENRA